MSLKEDVKKKFVPFNAPFEGVIRHFYLDIKGLVTIAIGVLVDPLPGGLPLRRKDGQLASAEEIAADWKRVKSRPELAQQGARAAAKVAELRLDQAGVEDVTLWRLGQQVAVLEKHFPGFADWPASAQLATVGLTWAVGADLPRGWPRLTAALRARDWSTAAQECKIREQGNPGVVPRNRAIKRLFEQAGAYDPDTVAPWL